MVLGLYNEMPRHQSPRVHSEEALLCLTWVGLSCMLQTLTWPGRGTQGPAQALALHPLLVAQPLTSREGARPHYRPGPWPEAGHKAHCVRGAAGSLVLS